MPAQAPTEWVQDVLAILGFLFEHFWELFALIFIIVFRKGLASILGRLEKGTFKILGWGEGGFQATPVPQAPEARPEVTQKSEPPSEPKSIELESKEAITEKVIEEGDLTYRIYEAVVAKDLERADELYDEQMRRLDDPDKRYAERAFYLYMLISMGNKRDELPNLAAFHATAANDNQLLASTSFLAGAFGIVKDNDNEEKVWREAIAKVGDEQAKTKFIAGLAAFYDREGLTDQGVDLLLDRLAVVTDRDQRALLYASLGALLKESHPADSAIALEKAVELSPGDEEKLFEAAYRQTSQKLELLGVANYQSLLAMNPRHSVGLNNLAVCAADLKVPGKKIELYKRAVALDLSLAMANLANQKTDAGMFDEAQEILDVARKQEHPHENVGGALSHLDQTRKADNERWEAISKNAVELQRKVRRFGTALFERPTAGKPWAGTWYTSEGDEVLARESPTYVFADWTEERPSVFGATNHQCTLIGRIRNRAARGSYTKKDTSDKKPKTLLDSVSESRIACYFYLSNDEQEWYIFSTDPEREYSAKLSRKKPGGTS